MIYVYDIETYKEAFIVVFKNIKDEKNYIFEISDRKNDYDKLVKFVKSVDYLIGFNNLAFDWPVFRSVILDKLDSYQAYEYANHIINKEYSQLPSWQEEIKQIDLYKIWHFDNKAKRTSLKWCEFFLRAPKLQDLPYKPGDSLTNKMIDQIIEYCINDVDATYELFKVSKDKLKLRKTLGKQYNLNLINANDPKIGSEIFASIISERLGVSKRTLLNMRTHRPVILIDELILPYISFKSKEFNHILNFFAKTIVINGDLKGVIENHINYKGLQYDYGAGGIHGSKTGIFKEDRNYMIIDIDVASYYPNLAIKNKFYPEHLGEEFCDIYEEVYNTRKLAKKKAKQEKDPVAIAVNAGLKLGLNGTYGKSNDKYSFFYDPAYTLKTTINGQLLLSMLAESLADISEVIQINTDGLTIRVKRSLESKVMSICRDWEQLTQLELEYAYYKKMVVRDVNNYIAQTINGYCKYKGVFEIDKEVAGEPALHKNNSYRIIPIALKEYFINNIPIEETLKNHKNIYDFCAGIRGRSGWKFKLRSQNSNKETLLQKTNRYYVSTNSSDTCALLIKYHDDGRESYVEAHPKSGCYYNCQIMNNYFETNNYKINYTYYERACRKIVNQIIDNQLNLF